VIVAQSVPGLGNPLEFTMKQFNKLCRAISEQPTPNGENDHRSHVEAEMRRIHGGR
tara:strand:+ start:319 stop:486 length:168 start_codon:yes stop_codon:yes gene_type:complete